MYRLTIPALTLVLVTACGTGAEPPAAGPTADASASAAPAPTRTSPSAAPSTAPSPTPSPTPAGAVIELSLAGGQVSGDIGRAPVRTGEPVTLRITSDIAEEVHVHGVDLYEDLQPGTTTTVEFTAPAPGVYEIELHGSGSILTRMQSS